MVETRRSAASASNHPFPSQSADSSTPPRLPRLSAPRLRMVLPLICGWRVGALERNLGLTWETLNCSTHPPSTGSFKAADVYDIEKLEDGQTESHALPLPQPSVDAENMNRQKKRGSSKQAKQNAKAAWGKLISQFSQIVDSVIALFRVDFTGRGELADRQ